MPNKVVKSDEPSGGRPSRPSNSRSAVKRAPSARSPAGTGITTRTARIAASACGEPLFDSATKFDSGTGWPSFTAAPRPRERRDHRRRQPRHAARRGGCGACGAHLGHVFPDGPAADRRALLHELGEPRLRAEKVTAPYRFYGAEISYFSAKVRPALRAKGVHYVEILPDYRDVILPRTGHGVHSDRRHAERRDVAGHQRHPRPARGARADAAALPDRHRCSESSRI